MKITKEIVQKLLDTVDQGLVQGLGEPIPGQMCVEAAVCYALDLPHNDNPKCVDMALRKYKIALNDGQWSSNAARANGMRRLAVLQLGTSEGFDTHYFAEELALRTVNILLPKILSDSGYTDFSEACTKSSTLRMAYNAAYTSTNGMFNESVYYAALTAVYADHDIYLLLSANIAEDILIEMNVPAVKYLYLVD